MTMRAARSIPPYADGVARIIAWVTKPQRNHDGSFSAIGRSGEQPAPSARCPAREARSEEHTSELQSLMRTLYAVFCLKKKKNQATTHYYTSHITSQLYP